MAYENQYNTIYNTAATPSPPATASATGGGGADPVSAIANAVGQIFSFLKDNVSIAAKSYYDRLKNAGNANYGSDALKFYQQKESILPMILIGICVFGIIVFVVVKQLKNNK